MKPCEISIEVSHTLSCSDCCRVRPLGGPPPTTTLPLRPAVLPLGVETFAATGEAAGESEVRRLAGSLEEGAGAAEVAGGRVRGDIRLSCWRYLRARCHAPLVAAAAAVKAPRFVRVHGRPFRANFSADEGCKKLVEFVDFLDDPLGKLGETDAAAAINVDQVERGIELVLVVNKSERIITRMRTKRDRVRKSTCLFRSFFGRRVKTLFGSDVRCCRCP